jgi:hypothetical protein
MDKRGPTCTSYILGGQGIAAEPAPESAYEE